MQEAPTTNAAARKPRRPVPAGVLILIACAILTLTLVCAESIVAMAIVVMDHSVALAVLAAAGVAGGWLVRPLGLGDADRVERMVLGGGLGIGFLSLIMLGLGTIGLLTHRVAVGLVGVLGVVALGRLVEEFEIPLTRRAVLDSGEQPEQGFSRDSESPQAENRCRTGSGPIERRCGLGHAGLWLLVVPFLVIALLATCLPPGVIWVEEGFGYDVLEYHLAVPKTFMEQGRITFLANNVYSNFPMNGEILFLLMMLLRGDPIESCFMATAVNVGLAALFIAAVWAAARTLAPRGATLVAVLAATLPWIAYLAGIAYVEPGMLAMGMCAMLALAPLLSDHRSARSVLPRVLVGGLLAGLACGYKYTAFPMIAVPLAIIPLLHPIGVPAVRRRLTAVLVFAFGVMVTFSPWLIRNTVNTRNPVFPLAWSVFGAKPGVWDAALEERWTRAHGSASAEQSAVPVWWRAVERSLGDFRMGGLDFGHGNPAVDQDGLRRQLRYHVVPGVLFILAFAGAVRGRPRVTWILLAILAVQTMVWLGGTHLFARFAVVMMMPLVLLAAQSVGVGGEGPATEGGAGIDANDGTREQALPRRSAVLADRRWHEACGCVATWCAYGLVVAGAGLNLYRLGSLYYHHTRVGSEPISAYGRTDAFLQGQWPGSRYVKALNALGPGARVMLVGEARSYYLRVPCEYATVFNHHPLAQAIHQRKDLRAVVASLRERGTTHLLVCWGELDRLGRTYGLEPELDPERDPTLYARLAAAGLREIAMDSGPSEATLFEVPQP